MQGRLVLHDPPSPRVDEGGVLYTPNTEKHDGAEQGRAGQGGNGRKAGIRRSRAREDMQDPFGHPHWINRAIPFSTVKSPTLADI